MLPIFPEGGLTSSVITTVWVGVFVLAFFNLRFGWVLSGLVVPGYVVPLLILRPMAAGIIVAEAVFTYLIVYWFSEKLARGRFNALFGRDRFMALVLASIAVRATFDGWLLPIAADWLSVHGDRQLDWHSNLQSFGLVVISLMANQFWKPGLARGLVSSGVIIGLTWLIVRYGLMEFTNFRLSGVSYTYEGLASSILASPKAYIILVLTAFIASQMNVRYGWDFSGILIPALIALQWYQPTKVLSSFVEAAVIFVLAQLVMKLPLFASMTIEGARKLLLFFNVSFVYKLVLGHALNLLALDVKTTDFYGFGYLLSTLLAIKAYEKDIFPRVMRNTLEVSVAGAAAGNLIGFLLALVLPANQSAVAAANRIVAGRETERLLALAVGQAHLQRSGLDPKAPDASQIRALADALELLESGAQPDFVASGLTGAGMVASRQRDGTFAISQRGTADLILFDPAATSRLVVSVPDAATQPGIAAAGLTLFRQQRARWLVLGSAPGPGSSLDALRQTLRPRELEVTANTADRAQLALSGSAAGGLDLGLLQNWLPGLETRFETTGNADRATLALGNRHLANLASRSTPPPVDQPLAECVLSAPPASPAANADLAELGFLRFEVAEPLIAGLDVAAGPSEVARRNAAMLGWTIDRCLINGREQWRLALPGAQAGSYLFDPAGTRNRLLEIAGQPDGIQALGIRIHREWRAGALLIAPDENHLIGGQRSAFGTISQTYIRALEQGSGKLIQLRRAPASATSGSFVNAALVPDIVERTGPWQRETMGVARAAGLQAVLVDRQADTAGLEVAPNYSVRYFSETGRGRFATLWLPDTAAPEVRP